MYKKIVNEHTTSPPKLLIKLFQVLILGNRDDIEEMPNSSSVVLMNVLKLIDQYDLYGQVAYPKHHKQSEVPDIYRLAAKTKVLNTKILLKQYETRKFY